MTVTQELKQKFFEYLDSLPIDTWNFYEHKFMTGYKSSFIRMQQEYYNGDENGLTDMDNHRFLGLKDYVLREYKHNWKDFKIEVKDFPEDRKKKILKAIEELKPFTDRNRYFKYGYYARSAINNRESLIERNFWYELENDVMEALFLNIKEDIIYNHVEELCDKYSVEPEIIEEIDYDEEEAKKKAPLLPKERIITEEEYKNIIYSDSFKAWFGDWENDPEKASKVVNDKGFPLIVYHGTPYFGFTEFDKSKMHKRDYGDFGDGFYFTPSRDYASSYGLKGYWPVSNTTSEEWVASKVYSCFLNIRNPRVWNAHWLNAIESYISPENDGIIVYHDTPFDDFTRSEIVAFEPNQIKSVFNCGNFSKASNNIYEKLIRHKRRLYY